MYHDWDRFYNETINGMEFVSYEYVPVPLQIAHITKLPRAFAPYEKQESTEFRTNAASDRIYNETAFLAPQGSPNWRKIVITNAAEGRQEKLAYIPNLRKSGG